MKVFLRKEDSKSVTNWHQLKMAAADGKKYLFDAAYLETLLRLIQAFPAARPK
jgi:DNA-damage-inducible protein D